MRILMHEHEAGLIKSALDLRKDGELKSCNCFPKQQQHLPIGRLKMPLSTPVALSGHLHDGAEALTHAMPFSAQS